METRSEHKSVIIMLVSPSAKNEGKILVHGVSVFEKSTGNSFNSLIAVCDKCFIVLIEQETKPGSEFVIRRAEV